MRKYQNLIKSLLTDPRTQVKSTRSGVYAISRFGNFFEYDLSKGFPIVTTRKINFKNIATELLWFLRGKTNIKYLHDHNVHIWDSWADDKGELGRVYGVQWCDWKDSEGASINQIEKVIDSIKKEPYSKRHVVSAWNPGEIDKMALPPCHLLFQFNVNKDKTLDCHLYQRAADVALGLIYNIASYSLLTHLIARETNLEPGRFIHSIGDLHIYCGKGERGRFYENYLQEIRQELNKKKQSYSDISRIIEKIAPLEEYESNFGRNGIYDHVPGLLKLLDREPYKSPKLRVDSSKGLFELGPLDISLIGYQFHSPIKFDVAI